MTQPIGMSLDTDVPGGAGYLRYSDAVAVRQDPLDEGYTVAVDLDADDHPVGIELTSLDAYAYDLLERAGKKYGLVVPGASALAIGRR